MLKTETREIAGRTFAVTTLGTQEGLRLFFMLTKLAGPAVVTLIKQWQGKSVTKQAIGDALAELLARLEWADLNDFVQTFAKSSDEIVTAVNDRGEHEQRRVKLKDTINNLAFAGDYLSLLKWIGFCLEVNFASFFADMGLTSPPSSVGEE